MLYSGTDPESYITEYTLLYEDNTFQVAPSSLGSGLHFRMCILGSRFRTGYSLQTP